LPKFVRDAKDLDNDAAIFVDNKRFCPASLATRSTRKSVDEQNKGFIVL
jgi:hypothetical protein